MNNIVQKNIELDRATKILLLSVLKQGYFTPENADFLRLLFSDNRPFIKLSNGTLIEI